MTRGLADIELLPLADTLADAEWHSGEALAVAAGISRAALAKRIVHLEDWGLDIEARAGLGYRMMQRLERLDRDVIANGLSTRSREILSDLRVELRVDSTNQRLLEADPARDPQALFAEAQTAGRGRRGRDWRSPFGANLYLSLAWSFAGWPPSIGTLPLAVGVACARALKAAGIEGIGLKWPNDLRVGDAKLGGILIEQKGEFGGACRVVIGIGINVSMSAGQAGVIGQEWTCLHTLIATPPSRNTLAACVLDGLISAIAEFTQTGFASFVGDWSRLDLSADRAVRIEGAGATLEGHARGIDEQGALIVETGDGRRHHLHAGEVSLRLTAES